MLARTALFLILDIAAVLPALGVWVLYRLFTDYYRPWAALLAGTATLTLFCLRGGLLGLRRHRPRSGRRRVTIAGVASLVLGSALLMSPLRPLSDTEQRVCRSAVEAAIMAEMSSTASRPGLPATSDLGLVLHGIVDRERDVRYAISHGITAAAEAAGAYAQDHGSDRSRERLAQASTRLQRHCGYRPPPIP